jgi:hypothetical protein
VKSQFDWTKRVVSLENLQAMCDRISGISHTFEVSNVSRSRVHVTYSNPDEYGRPDPVTAVFPCYPCADQPCIVLDALRYVNSPGEEWQAFEQLYACPTLWRVNVQGVDEWFSHRELRDAGMDARHNLGLAMPDTCTVCDLPTSDDTKGGR